MKTIKCPLCGARHKNTEFKDREICFSCDCIKAMLTALSLTLGTAEYYNKQSREYWTNKISSIL